MKSNLSKVLSKGITIISIMVLFINSGGAQSYSIDQSGIYAPVYDNPSYVYLYEDEILGPLPIGFDFMFYDNVYDSVYASSNGFLTFSDLYDPGSGGGQHLPNAIDPNNLIAGVWTQFTTYAYDIEISYETIGTAPNRTFHVNYYAGDDCYTSAEFQIILYEGTNIIEIHTGYWDSYGCYDATQGVENEFGDESTALSNRNASSSWYLSDDYIAFIPPITAENDAAVAGNVATYCQGLQDIKTIIGNEGVNNITTVTVNWSWNGTVQSPVIHNTTISPGNNQIVTLGSQSLTAGDLDTLVVWTSNPNGMTDPNPDNDTITSTVKVGLHGSYTIGGTSPDFTSINDAVDSLHAVGICDSVIFNIRDGAYFEQVDLMLFAKVNSEDKVIFQSESGDSADVQIIYPATGSSQNYVVKLNNAQNVLFKNLSFHATGNSYSRVFHIAGQSNNIGIYGCKLEGKLINSSSIDYANVFIDTQGDNIEIADCHIIKGSLGIYHYPEFSGFLNEGIKIQNNKLTNFNAHGIRLYSTSSPRISGNELIGSFYSSDNGISINEGSGDSLQILNNFVDLKIGLKGISVDNYQGGSGSYIANNMVTIKGTGTATGIQLGQNDSISVIFNNVLIQNTNTEACAISVSSCDDLIVANNIFKNEGTGLTVITNEFNPTVSLDYNNLFHAGTYIAKGNNGSYVYYPEFADWQSATSWETNGLNVDPYFAADTNLHVSQVILNKRGLPFSGISTDFDGESRNALNPDIGADEFDALMDDLATEALLSPGLDCNGSQNVVALVQNYGNNQVANYDVNWTLDGIGQPPVSVTNTIDTLGGSSHDTAHINLGTIALNPGQLYTFKIWTSLPNGNTDGNTVNDTLTSYYKLPLSGSYTVGSSGADYLSLSNAFSSLDSNGVCGPVIFNILDGEYTGQYVLKPYPGMSAVNNLTITSASQDSAKVKLVFNSNTTEDNYILKVVNVDYLTISHLSFKSNNPFRCRNLALDGQTKNLLIEHNHFTGHKNLYSNSQLIYAEGFTDSMNISIKENIFTGGSAGIHVYGINNQNRYSNISIIENEFVNQNTSGIDLLYLSDFSINNNWIKRDYDNSNSPVAIKVRYAEGNNHVKANNIQSKTKGVGAYFQHLNELNLSSKLNFHNNMVSIQDGNYAVLFSSSVRIHCLHNNLLNETDNSFSKALSSSNSDTLNIKNNNLHAKVGTAMSIAYSTDSISSDYNNIYSEGFTQVGSWLGSYTSLGDWQVASGQDQNSVSVDPLYFSSSNLHILADTLNGLATPLAEVSHDFDNEARDPLTPDIGADEILTQALDIAILDAYPKMPFAQGSQDISVVVYNYGTTDVSTANIDWTVNGMSKPTFAYPGIVESNSFDTIIIGSANFNFDTAYHLSIWTSMPNGGMDENQSNDTIQIQDLYAAVNGVRTIAGLSPDFTDIDHAIDAMNLGGVLDSVTFLIRSGTYSDSLVFAHSSFFNCETPVTFQSETGNAADVVFENSGINTVPLWINGADGLQFKHLTFKSVLTTHANTVLINNESNCIRFDSCHFEALLTTASGLNKALIYSDGDTDTANVFVNNIFKNGSYGLALYGITSNREPGTYIKDNQFLDQYYRGIYLVYQKRPKVLNNYFQTDEANTGLSAVHLYRCSEGFEVNANNIYYKNRSGTGLYFDQANGIAANKGIASNNMILIGDGYSTGLYIYSSSYGLIAYNNILVEGSNTSSRSYYSRQSSDNIDVLNNNFINEAGGYSMHFWTNDEINSCNFNNLTTNGPILVRRSSSDFSDLISWQSTGFDLNSISENPDFVDTTDLHVQSAFLNGAASPLPEVTYDFDGEPRDPLFPDIGADEFSLVTDDVGILEINYPNQPFPSGEQTIFVKFINNGNDTLTSMTVNFTVNGDTMPTYLWTGLLPSAATYDSLDIGIYNFLPDSSHTIKAWVSAPNGLQDGLAANDTLTATGLFPGLLGTYTIGGTDPDFLTISDALRILNTGGAAGDVILNIRDGVYADTLVFLDYPSSNCANSIIIQSESQDTASVMITNLGLNQFPIVFEGADGITIQHLTIQTVNPAYARVITLSNESNCNTFNGNHIIGFNNNSNSQNYNLVHDYPSHHNAQNTFKNNIFRYGSFGLYLYNGGSLSSGTKVIDNQFIQNYYRNIYAVYHHGIEISGNYLHSTNSANSTTGIYLLECDSAISIVKNHIYLPLARWGIFIGTGNASSSHPSTIINNFVSNGNHEGSSGIYLSDVNHSRLYHNNVLNTGTNTSTSGNSAIRINQSDNIDIRNNIFSSDGGALAIEVSTSSTLDFLDNNNYHSNAANLGVWEGVSAADLPSWQALSGEDASSVSTNPGYMSDSDLHVGSVLLNGTGQISLGITHDFDGDLRSSPPDIGADEFNPAASNDAGIFAFMNPKIPFPAGNHQVTIALKNFGGNNLTSSNIRWTVNGIEQMVHNWTGNLSPGACDTIILGSYDFIDITPHDILFWSEMPNGQIDSSSYNDTLEILDLYPALLGTYTLGGLLPDFNLFSELETVLSIGGIAGNVTVEVRNGQYSEQMEIADFPRLSENHQLLIKSESNIASDVTIIRDFSGDNFTLYFNGARGIKIENLTLKSNYGRVVEIDSESRNISFNNCVFEGKETTSGGINYALVYSGSSTEDSLSFLNSTFKYGSYGMRLAGSSGDVETDLIIEGNIFSDHAYAAIHLQNGSGPKIVNNTIYDMKPNGYFGMYLRNIKDSFQVKRNQIILPNLGVGIQLYNCVMPGSNLGVIANNFIHMQGTGTAKGIVFYNADYTDMYYNTINLTNTNSNSICFELDGGSSVGLTVQNNIFANFGGGLSLYSYYTSSIQNFDYNNFYSTGPNLLRYGNFHANLLALQVGTATNLNSLSLDPYFIDLNKVHISQHLLNGQAIPIPSELFDIDGDLRDALNPDIGADEFTTPTHDIAVTDLLSPSTYCGLSNMEDVTLRIENRGANPASGFDIAYIHGTNIVSENIGAVSIPAGAFYEYTFTAKADLSSVGTHQITGYVSYISDNNANNDTLYNQIIEHIPALVSPPTNLVPIDLATDQDKPIGLSWAPAAHADFYDVFIWPSGDSEPVIPQIENIPHINTTYNNVNYSGTYNWKVVAKNVCNQMQSSSTQSFTIRHLPDLIVDTVVAPITAFSGQEISVSWEIKNTGSGSTLSNSWTDAVYLSTDATFNPYVDTYLGGVQNLASLLPGIAYSHSMNVTLPQTVVGNYYLFVVTDRYTDIIESNESNNYERTQVYSTITLSPFPDLVVTNISVPPTAFSGQNIQIQYTVKNQGSAATGTNSNWHDVIGLGTDPLNAAGTQLGIESITSELLPDSSYLRILNVSLPNGISGNHYIYVRSDEFNSIFEFSAEQNNNLVSSAFPVILSPPADLVITGLEIPDTLSSAEKFNLTRILENQGAGNTVASYWVDRFYISKSPVYNPNFNEQIHSNYGYSMLSLEKDTSTFLAKVPDEASGSYYVYAYTDVFEDEFEYDMEANNQYAHPDQIFIVNPDIIIDSIMFPDTVIANEVHSINWKQLNLGLGKVFNKRIDTKIYASNSPSFDESAILLVNSVKFGVTQLPGDTISYERDISIPPSLNGLCYIHFILDDGDRVFESAGDTNNIFTIPTPIFVIEGLIPNLQVTSISVPDTLIAGSLFTYDYVTSNTGFASVNADWEDQIYFSFDTIWNPITSVLIGTSSQNAGLPYGQSIVNNKSHLLDINTASNFYFIHILSDIDDDVYEGSGENNNIKFSDSIFVALPPSVDLGVDTFKMENNPLMSGQIYTAEWTVSVRNGQEPYANSWRDRIYLSSDATLDTLNDVKVGDYLMLQTDLGFSASNPYTAVRNFEIPNGISGTYYLFVLSDANLTYFDPNRTNNEGVVRASNGIAKQITIHLSPSPDLTITSFQAPNQPISGQNFSIDLQIKNIGTDIAQAGQWSNRIYISNDITLDNGDLLLVDNIGSTLPQNGDSTYQYSVVIPSNYVGNYVLIAVTDALNQIYEHAGEHNNSATRSAEVILPPPSDLKVKDIIIPIQVIAGEDMSISWNTLNQGANPAEGLLRELVYLSPDTIWDINDPLFHALDDTIYLPPLAQLERDLNAPARNVSNGEYFAIVQTDVTQHINESNEENNYSPSPSVVNIDVKTLQIDSLTCDTLYNAAELYYKIVIPPGLEGESMIITMDGDSTNGINELYARYDEIPSRYHFDHGFDQPLNGKQRLIIPSLEVGTYYILGYGINPTSSFQKVDILATIVPFSLFQITPNIGVQNQKVTVEVTGIKLLNTETFRIRNSNPWFELVAESVYEYSDNKVYATFDLTNVPVDTYSFDAIKADSSLAFIHNGFQVVETGQEDVQLTINTPSYINVRRPPVRIEINFVNVGNVDAINPTAVIRAPGGNNIHHTFEGIVNGLGAPVMVVSLTETNGPPGILRPGGAGTIVVYASPNPFPSFTIHKPE